MAWKVIGTVITFAGLGLFGGDASLLGMILFIIGLALIMKGGSEVDKILPPRP
jgi:uncharacterized protein YebE (UPF0316 family)